MKKRKGSSKKKRSFISSAAVPLRVKKSHADHFILLLRQMSTYIHQAFIVQDNEGFTLLKLQIQRLNNQVKNLPFSLSEKRRAKEAATQIAVIPSLSNFEEIRMKLIYFFEVIKKLSSQIGVEEEATEALSAVNEALDRVQVKQVQENSLRLLSVPITNPVILIHLIDNLPVYLKEAITQSNVITRIQFSDVLYGILKQIILLGSLPIHNERLRIIGNHLITLFEKESLSVVLIKELMTSFIAALSVTIEDLNISIDNKASLLRSLSAILNSYSLYIPSSLEQQIVGSMENRSGKIEVGEKEHSYKIEETAEEGATETAQVEEDEVDVLHPPDVTQSIEEVEVIGVPGDAVATEEPEGILEEGSTEAAQVEENEEEALHPVDVTQAIEEVEVIEVLEDAGKSEEPEETEGIFEKGATEAAQVEENEEEALHPVDVTQAIEEVEVIEVLEDAGKSEEPEETEGIFEKGATEAAQVEENEAEALHPVDVTQAIEKVEVIEVPEDAGTSDEPEETEGVVEEGSTEAAQVEENEVEAILPVDVTQSIEEVDVIGVPEATGATEEPEVTEESEEPVVEGATETAQVEENEAEALHSVDVTQAIEEVEVIEVSEDVDATEEPEETEETEGVVEEGATETAQVEENEAEVIFPVEVAQSIEEVEVIEVPEDAGRATRDTDVKRLKTVTGGSLLYNSNGVTQTVATIKPIIFNLSTLQGIIFDGVSKLTVITAGFYYFDWQISLDKNQVTPSTFGIVINGNLGSTANLNSSSIHAEVSGSGVISLGEGNTIELYNLSSGTIEVIAPTEAVRFSIFRIES
ncbi:hypothetical protein [Paenibacillus sp. GCM10028914]|uniref:hypothetical protein n=1 Tax=Paenibacillus sp. GCM10028914 TaxID=3273416 RepID=UPI00360621F1